MRRIIANAGRLGTALAVCALAVGCGSGGPVMGRVSGTVSFEGKPLEKGTVTFIPTDDKRPPATGTIQAGGYYVLKTTEPGDGAVVGQYKVAVSDIDSEVLNTPLPGMPVKVPKSAIPKKYLDANTSSLEAAVESGSQTRDFDLQDDGTAGAAEKSSKKK